MKFWQAMKIVDEGGKVRRKRWGTEVPNVYLSPDGFVSFDTLVEKDYEPTATALVANDWEEVVDTVSGA